MTWFFGENNYLDELFNDLRSAQEKNVNDKLHKNYSSTHFHNSMAYTICFDDITPVLCSSIAYKNCWPPKCYRILNRLWKPVEERIKFPRRMSTSFKILAESQIDWLNKNTDCELYFISRSSTNWEKWVADEFYSHGIEFRLSKYKYKTCDTVNDDSCWQNIIYNGNESILDQWNRK